MYNKEELIKGFNIILPELGAYVIENRLKLDAATLKGEFYTKIRRYLPQLTNPSSNPITKNNIETIYFDINTGVIQHINFLCSHGGCYKPDLIDTLNNILSTIDMDFKEFAFEKKVEDIIYKVNIYNF